MISLPIAGSNLAIKPLSCRSGVSGMHFILAGSFTLHNTPLGTPLTAGEVEIRVLQFPSGRQNLTLPDYFRVARNPTRIDGKCGDHFLQAGAIRRYPFFLGDVWGAIVPTGTSSDSTPR